MSTFEVKMLQKLQQHISNKFPFLKDAKLLIAISGGVDSVVLTQLLLKLKFDISLAHCNFRLRATESDLDEIFVKELAKKHHFNCFTKSFDTEKFALKNKQSKQLAARNLRYEWFQEIVHEHGFDYVLTAHHADDNFETFLINLTRGSGLDGFTGIPPIHKNIARPLLIFSREEIINFATENSIDWREDQSNTTTKYLRNKIRHQVVPVLKEINPSLLEGFSKTIRNLQESKQLVADRVEEIQSKILIPIQTTKGKESFQIDIQKVLALSAPKAYLFQLLKAYQFTEYDDVFNLLTAQSGKQLFSKTHVLSKDREVLMLSKIQYQEETTSYLIAESTSEIEFPIHLKIEPIFEKSNNTINSICVSKEALSFPLIIRKWKHGDIFYPKGMQGKKKLSKYFKDEKYSLLEKEQTWLLCNNDDTIIWVIGKRQDQRFAASSNQPHSIQICFTEKT